MSASLIYELAPIGSIVAWSDGTPRPPERHKKKLAAWKARNSQGRLIRKEGPRTLGTYTAPASFTVHEGNIGSGNTIMVTILRTFELDSSLAFKVLERPRLGSVRVFDRAGPFHELVHLAEGHVAAEEWLKVHRHPLAVLEEVTADEIASTPAHAGVEFGISADGFPVARFGDTSLAMVPTDEGSVSFLASAWRVTRPLTDLKRRDFYGHEGRLDSEAAFRARVFETAEQKRALSALGRIQTRMTASTPWGLSQMATIYDEGVVAHTTASHGGFHLSPARNQ